MSSVRVTIVDKVLRQIFTFGAFAHTPDVNTTLPAVFYDFQHCIRWGGREVQHFQNFNLKFTLFCTSF